VHVFVPSFPALRRLEETTLDYEAAITYKIPTAVGQSITNYITLTNNESSNQREEHLGAVFV